MPLQTARKTVLPDLPPEIWRAIANHLSQADLSAVSQTTRQFHSAVVTEDLFRHVLEHRTGNSVIPSDSPKPSVLFRRSCALRHRPSRCSHSVLSDTALCAIATFSNSVVFYSSSREILLSYPYDWTRSAPELCDAVRQLPSYTIQLPGSKIGILRSTVGAQLPATKHRSTSLTILDALTGRTLSVLSLPLGETPIIPAPVHGAATHTKVFLLAGRRAQYIAYLVNGCQFLRLFNWKNAQVVRDVPLGQSFSLKRLVRANLNEIPGFVVTGLVGDKESTAVDSNTFHVCPFDRETRPTDRLRVDPPYRLQDVVQSLDGNVTAYRVNCDRGRSVIWRQQQPAFDSFEKHTTEEDSPPLVTWPLQIPSMTASFDFRTSEEFSITGNGRHILLLPQGIPAPLIPKNDGRAMRASFDKEGKLESIDSVGGPRHAFRTHWTWAQLGLDNRILLLCSQPIGFILAFDLQCGKRLWSCEAPEGLTNIVLVGEHYLVATGRDTGRFYVWRFDAYCRRRELHPRHTDNSTDPH